MSGGIPFDQLYGGEAGPEAPAAGNQQATVRVPRNNPSPAPYAIPFAAASVRVENPSGVWYSINGEQVPPWTLGAVLWLPQPSAQLQVEVSTPGGQTSDDEGDDLVIRAMEWREDLSPGVLSPQKLLDLIAEIVTLQARVTDVNTSLGTTNAKLTDVNTALGGTNTRLDTTNTKLTDVNTALNTTNNSLNTVNTNLNTTNNNLNKLNSNITGLRDQIDRSFPPDLQIASVAAAVTGGVAGVDQDTIVVAAPAAGSRLRIAAVGVTPHEANVAAGARLRSVTRASGGATDITVHGIVVDQYPESWVPIAGGYALPAATALILTSRSSIANFEARVTAHYTTEAA